jgi:peroxiredoxin
MPTLEWSDAAAIASAGLTIPALALRSTRGVIDVGALCAERAVLYAHPATGVPGRDPAIDPAPGWDDIPGAAGCTPQSLGFKEAYPAFARLLEDNCVAELRGTRL